MKKKALAAVLVLGVIGATAFALTRSPERSACLRVADLCGTQNGTKQDLDQCVDDIKQFRKVAGDEAADRGIVCVEGAKTCGEAAGCVAGAGFKGIQGVVDGFFKGFGNATK